MKKTILLLVAALLAATPLAAQSMPSRATEVAAIVDQHRALFARGDDGRRELLAWIAAGLNAQDGGHWGLLQKPTKIPADILVWRPTREHVDVLTDDGPIWRPLPPIPDDWHWIDAPLLAAPAPAPAAGPTASPTTDAAQLDRIEQKVDALDATVATQAQVQEIRETLHSWRKELLTFLGERVAPVVVSILATWRAMR